MEPWWGYNKDQGWVVLDRSIPSNAPGLKGDLIFFRCRDTSTYVAKRDTWRPPLYRFAPNYLTALKEPEAATATAEFEALKGRWPEFEREIHRMRDEEGEKAEAVRLEAEKEKKAAAKEKRKKAAAVKEE
jgi:hypothetical protein